MLMTASQYCVSVRYRWFQMVNPLLFLLSLGFRDSLNHSLLYVSIKFLIYSHLLMKGGLDLLNYPQGLFLI